MKFNFRSYGFTTDGSGFPSGDQNLPTLAAALEELRNCWTHGSGWVEVSINSKPVAICHLVYTDGKLTKIHKFKRDEYNS